MALTPLKEWLYGHTDNVSVVGNRLCATFGNVLRIYDITNQSSPSLLREIPYSGIVYGGGLVTGRLLVSNSSMVAVGQFGEGVVITNLSNYTTVRKNYYVTSVYSYGNNLYIGSDTRYVVLDVTNPSNPIEMSSVTATVDGIFTNGSIICCTHGTVLDIRNMGGGLIATYDFGATSYGITGLDFYGNTIIVGTRIGQVHKVSSSGTIMGTYDSGAVTGVKIGVHSSGYAVCAFHDFQVQILNVNPSVPSYVSAYNYSATIAGYPRDVRVVGNTFFMAAHMRGVDIVNISSVSSPSEITKIPGYGRTYACTISNDARYMFLTDDWGLRILDISGTPTQVKYIDNIGRSDLSLYLDRTKNWLYGVFSWGGLKIFNVSNPANATIILDYNPADYIDSIVVYNNKLYCNVGAYMKVFSVTASMTLSDLGTYALPGRVQYVHDVYNNVIYASHENIVELIDANTLAQKSTITAAGWVYKIKVYNNIMYMCSYTYGLEIYDVTNPSSPVYKSLTKFGYGNNNAVNTADGKTAYMGVGGYFIKVNISNPSSPTQLDQSYEDNGREVEYVDMYNGYMSVAFGGEGVKLYSYTGVTTCNVPSLLLRVS